MPKIPPEDILYGINTLIEFSGSQPLPGPCPTGTLNNLNVSCESSLSFEGTYGNKTTDGYYITYGGAVDIVQNILDFNVTSTVPETSETEFSITYSGAFEFPYYQDIQFSGNANGSVTVYIPETQTTAIACGCCTTCIGNCWDGLSCGCGLDTVQCDCISTTTTWPSTYAASLPIGFSSSYTSLIQGSSLIGVISYTVSIFPSPQINYIAIPIPSDVPAGTPIGYLDIIEISGLTINYSGIATTITEFPTFPVVLDQNEVNQLLTLFFGSFQTQLTKVLNANGIAFTSMGST